MNASLAATNISALQAALAAEHAAVFGYGVVGAHTAGVARAGARRAMHWHQDQQASLTAALVAASATPPPAEPAYPLPFPVTSTMTAIQLAARIEEGVAAAYADLVTESAAADRGPFAQALASCAVRTVTWTGRSVPFPGLPERASG